MQKDLLVEVRERRREYQKNILEAIGHQTYECGRYNVNLSLAILDSDSVMHLEEFAQTLRDTDSFIALDEHTYCLIFPFTDTAQGVKAASNLLSKFEMKDFSAKIYLGVVNIENCEAPEREVGELFDILEYAISNGMNNIPLNSTIFGDI